MGWLSNFFFQPFKKVDHYVAPILPSALAPNLTPTFNAKQFNTMHANRQVLQLPFNPPQIANSDIVAMVPATSGTISQAARAFGSAGLPIDPLGRRGQGAQPRSTILGK